MSVETSEYRLEQFAAMVTRQGGTAIVQSISRMKLGEPQTTRYARVGEEGFEIRQVAIRQCTRSEYLAYPWPDGHGEDYPGACYYELTFD